jgi:hypothetical protein
MAAPVSRAAQKTFEAFHSRNTGPAVFPFEAGEDGQFSMEFGFPSFVCVGRAVRVLYDSDKWNEIGDVIGYYHDHGPQDGKLVFGKQNRTKLFAPKPFFPELTTVKFPVKWPTEVVPLGACSGWFAQENPRDEKLIEGKCSGDILVCSPFGWVSKSDKERVFLAIIEIDTGFVEGIITGPDLRVTPAGITG